ncbi:MAG: helix-hairpin-helix domain-containing protein [Verrucomicrobiota bacterium]
MIKSLGRVFARLVASHVELHPSKTCPECGSQLARETDKAEDDWHCPNPDCPPQVLKRVALWASPKAMDIQGCDDTVVKQLVNRGLVRDGAEFYRLRVAEIGALDGLTKEGAQKIFDAITASMKREAWRVLFGLGIPNISATEAQALCKHFPTLDALFAAGRERLAKLEGVTELTARSLTHWYGDPVNRKLVQRLEKLGVNFKC